MDKKKRWATAAIACMLLVAGGTMLLSSRKEESPQVQAAVAVATEHVMKEFEQQMVYGETRVLDEPPVYVVEFHAKEAPQLKYYVTVTDDLQLAGDEYILSPEMGAEQDI